MLIPYQIFKNIIVSCDTESSRFALGAVLFERISGTCYAVATDGRRLSVVSWQEETNIADGFIEQNTDCSFSIPVSTCKEFAKIGAKNKKGFKATNCIMLDENFAGKDIIEARYYVDGMVQIMQVRQQEGRFPKWKDVIPSACENKFTNYGVNAETMAELLQLSYDISPNEERFAATLSMPHDSSKAMIVSRENAGFKIFNVLLPCENHNNPQFVPFNSESAYSDFRDAKTDLASEIDDLKAEVKRLNAALEFEQEVNAKLCKNNKESQDVERVRFEKDKEIDALKACLQNYKDENCKLKLDNKVLEDTIDTMQTDDRTELENKIVKLENDIDALKCDLKLAEKDVEYYQNIDNEHDSNVKKLELQIACLEAQVIDAQRESYLSHSVEEFRLTEQLRVKTMLLADTRASLERETKRNAVLNSSLRALRMEMNEMADTVNA